MTSVLPNIGLLAGIPLLALGTWGLRRSWPQLTLRARSVSVIAAIACAIGILAWGEYSPSQTEKYIGFPFLSVAFIRRGGHVRDYLGPLTVPALVANAYIGFTIPFLVLVVAVWQLARRRRAA